MNEAVEPTGGLTDAGGAVWEAFAEPDWSRFVDDGWVSEVPSDDPFHEYVVTCMTERRLREFCEVIAASEGLDPRQFAFETIGAWDATYWKTLPSGHRARLTGSPRQTWNDDRAPGMAVNWLRQAWCNDWPV